MNTIKLLNIAKLTTANSDLDQVRRADLCDGYHLQMLDLSQEKKKEKEKDIDLRDIFCDNFGDIFNDNMVFTISISYYDF